MRSSIACRAFATSLVTRALLAQQVRFDVQRGVPTDIMRCCHLG